MDKGVKLEKIRNIRHEKYPQLAFVNLLSTARKQKMKGGEKSGSRI